jgi:hypothetical protein
MMRYYVYLGFAIFGIIATLLGRGNEEIVFTMGVLYFGSTLALTFRLIDLKEESETNPQERPTYHYERKATFNFENYARAALLIIAALLLVNSGNNWWLFLIVIWLLSSLTIAVPFYLNYRDRDWDIVSEALLQEFKAKLNRQDIKQIREDLATSTIKDLTPEAIQAPKLTAEDKAKYLQLYIKLVREVS